MNETAAERIGARLRAARTARGTTLVELAAATGISASTLSRLESGKRPRLDLVALFFGYLIGIATIAVMTWIYAGRPLWH